MENLCLDLRMSLKSEMTAITYADTRINELMHTKIREWYNTIMLSIYSNPDIQSNMIAFFQHKQILPVGPASDENLKKFIHDTFSATDLTDQQKKTRENIINETFNIAFKQDSSYIFKFSTVFDLFFIIYLKGGMATRYICMLLNTLSDGNMFSAELLQEQLGAVSDYDFNCIINPTFERPVYELFYNLIKNILTIECHRIASTDPFFYDEGVRASFYQNAGTVASKFPVIYSGGCNIINNQPLGRSSYIEINDKFALVRLMANVPVMCSGSICFKDETGSGKNNTNILAELIDVSIPLFNNLEERNHAWNYGNKAIAIKWCFINQNKCDPAKSNEEKYSLTNKIRVYSLQSAIDDLTITIRNTEESGDTSKIEKRKRRLNFFRNLICQYTLIINQQDDTIDTDELSKYCVQNVEGLLCTNEYVDSDISLVLAQFSLGLNQDTNLVFLIVFKYINYILGTNLINSAIFYTFPKDYYSFISSLSAEQLNQIKPFVCNLLINTISLNKSLNDNFILGFIGFLFLEILSYLWTNISGFIPTVGNFNRTLISAMESVNNFSTRIFITKYARHIFDNLFKIIQGIYPNEAVQVLIRGGCAVHLNINPSFESMNTNDIDLVINLQRYDNQLITSLQQMFEAILAEIRQANPSWDMKFEYILQGQLFQVVMDYDITVVVPGQTHPINTSAGIISLQMSIPRIRHHILEINFVSSPSKIYSDDQVIQLSNDGIHECVYYNSTFLIKEYNKLLMESKHWYRKSKYLRRIAALNGIITDSIARRLYESEFPITS